MNKMMFYLSNFFYIIFHLCFCLVHALQIESTEGDLPVSVVLVCHHHRVERVAVEGVDVGARVLQVGRSGPAERAVVAVRVLDLGLRVLPENKVSLVMGKSNFPILALYNIDPVN